MTVPLRYVWTIVPLTHRERIEEHDEARLFSSWGEYALCYDALMALKPYQQLVADVMHELAPAPNDTVLDVCCGTGTLLREIGRSVPGDSCTGVDFSSAMLERARTKCGARLIESDLSQSIPFPHASFTKLACVNGLYTMPHPGHFLTECFRVLAPRGVAVIATPKRGFENGLILKAHCGSALPDVHWANAHASPEREQQLIAEAITDSIIAEQMLTVARHNRSIRGTAAFTFFDERELCEVVQRAGFAVRTCRPAYANQGILIAATKE